MRTCIGQFLRSIRLQNGEILKTMAERLEVSSAFLSAVENGKKKMPDNWIRRLGDLYNLSDEQMEELRTAQMQSAEVVELNIKNAPAVNRDLAICLARRFDELDADKSRRIMEILRDFEDE